ncbi:MAG: zinc-dependent metalloprotease [Propionibacteriaceae bacterium]|jgi:coenzyme F420 biosynthesis associated uncharacterized protein|nr:zinc-dependent metalloprotease [Propionibacteriaceae bacterium]
MNAINWELATRIANKLTKPGPQFSKREMAVGVAELRAAASEAIDLVVNTSGLPNDGRAAVYVVDRPTIITVNIANSAYLFQASGTDKLLPDETAADNLFGVVLGTVMSYLAHGVLGQFVPFQHSALYLVAPNIMGMERRLNVDPHDFRLWVCLHEQTHQAQFAAAPWMAERLLQLIAQVTLAEKDTQQLADTLLRTGEKILKAGRKELRDTGIVNLIRQAAPAEMSAALDAVTAQMSLLEGHADVIMDEVGPGVIKSLADIRAKFDNRRAERTKGIKSLPAKLTGMDAKMAQYADGAQFCRGVIRETDMDTLNLAFAAPENLPSVPELADPASWIARVTGTRQQPSNAPAPSHSPARRAAPVSETTERTSASSQSAIEPKVG